MEERGLWKLRINRAKIKFLCQTAEFESRNKEVKELRKLSQVVNSKLSLGSFAIPVFMDLVGSASDAAGMALFIPLIRGVTEQHFDFVHNTPGLGKVMQFVFGQKLPSEGTIFFSLLIGIYILISIRSALNFYSVSLIVGKVRNFCHELRVTLFNRIVSMPQKYFDARNPNNLQNAVVMSTQKLGAEAERLSVLFADIFKCIIFSAFLFVVSWKLTLLVITIPPILYLVLRSQYFKIRQHARQSTGLTNEMTQKMRNSMDCIPLIRSLNAEALEMESFRRRSKEVERIELRTDFLVRMIRPLEENFDIVAFLLVVAAAYFIFPEMRKGQFASQAVYLVVLRRLIHSLIFTGSLKQIITRLSGNIEQIYDVIMDSEKPEFQIVQGDQILDKLRSAIVLKEINFSYPGREPLLQNVNFEIRSGRVTALVGATGTGKSTLLNLLTRTFEPEGGQILIDGKDIKEFKLSSLRDKFAYITQNIFLFDGTLRENICFGLDREISDPELNEAVELACLKDFVADLPNGLETQIGDRGIRVSGGEKQRISLARSFLRDPEIILLDEPSAALDTTTEKIIWDNAIRVWKDKTIVLVTHRLSMLDKVHDILNLSRKGIENLSPPSAEC
jgi:ABC-type multidrug transport system fused ATPase/permease subunit